MYSIFYFSCIKLWSNGLISLPVRKSYLSINVYIKLWSNCLISLPVRKSYLSISVAFFVFFEDSFAAVFYNVYCLSSLITFLALYSHYISFLIILLLKSNFTKNCKKNSTKKYTNRILVCFVGASIKNSLKVMEINIRRVIICYTEVNIYFKFSF